MSGEFGVFRERAAAIGIAGLAVLGPFTVASCNSVDTRPPETTAVEALSPEQLAAKKMMKDLVTDVIAEADRRGIKGIPEDGGAHPPNGSILSFSSPGFDSEGNPVEYQVNVRSDQMDGTVTPDTVREIDVALFPEVGEATGFASSELWAMHKIPGDDGKDTFRVINGKTGTPTKYLSTNPQAPDAFLTTSETDDQKQKALAYLAHTGVKP